jgi:hypothetical protein
MALSQSDIFRSNRALNATLPATWRSVMSSRTDLLTHPRSSSPGDQESVSAPKATSSSVLERRALRMGTSDSAPGTALTTAPPWGEARPRAIGSASRAQAQRRREQKNRSSPIVAVTDEDGYYEESTSDDDGPSYGKELSWVRQHQRSSPVNPMVMSPGSSSSPAQAGRPRVPVHPPGLMTPRASPMALGGVTAREITPVQRTGFSLRELHPPTY